MNLLEGVVVQIQGLSSSAGDISRLHVILKQAEESLRSESTRLSPILNQLDPSNHSLGYLYILYALLHPPNYTVSFLFYLLFFLSVNIHYARVYIFEKFVLFNFYWSESVEVVWLRGKPRKEK